MSLSLSLTVVVSAALAAGPGGPAPPATRTAARELLSPPSLERLPMLTSDQAWARLPGAPGPAQPLPPWARQLAGPYPLTTARMLELDTLHRTGSRLEPRLRGLARWAAADANGCDYARAVAAADLRRDEACDQDPAALAADPDRLTPAERAVVAFARTMMRRADTVTDDEVKRLLHLLGEERTVALVALLAHASFQDRLFLAFGVQVGPEGPLPPLAVTFARPKPPAPSSPSAPAARTGAGKDAGPAAGPAAAGDWLALQERLDRQRARQARIRVPSREEMLGRIGPDHPAAWQTDLLWSRVCYTHQPELTDAWFATVAAFRQEAQLDPVFGQCLFWVVTRSLQCFY